MGQICLESQQGVKKNIRQKKREKRERLEERLEKIKYLTIKEEEKKQVFASPEDEVLHKLNEAKKNPLNIDKVDSKIYIP